MEKVKKRNGTIVSYDSEKIANCIRKACKDVKDTMSKEELKQIVSEIEERLSGIKVPGVERIQDTVESVLMKTKHEKAAKAYIIYRSEHAKIRDTQQTLIDKMMEVTFKTGEESDYKRSNANIPSDTTMGSMLIYGTTVSNYFNDNYVYPKKYIAADRKGLIHIHDKDFSMLTWNCVTGDTLTTIKENGKLMFVPMNYFDSLFGNDNEVVDVSDKDLQVLSKNSNFTKIKHIMRRKEAEKIYKITMGNQKSISATADHILEVTRNGQTLETTVKELQVGDVLPLTIYPENDTPLTELNLIEAFGKDNTSVIIKNSKLIRRSILWKDKKKLEEILHKNHPEYKMVTLSTICLTIADYYDAKHLISTDLDEHDLQLSVRQGKSAIPAILPINEDLGKFIGYILSEGHVSKADLNIVFANTDRNILDEFISICSRLFPNAHIAEYSGGNSPCKKITLLGSVIVKLFEGILANKDKSTNISLPDWIKYANKDFIIALVTAEIDGDGVYSARDATASSNSKEYLLQLQEILTLHNIQSKVFVSSKAGSDGEINGHKFIRNYDTYTLKISSEDYDKFFTVAKNSSKRIVLAYKADENARNNIIRFGKVKSIEELPFNGYVYDFETEDHFFDANGFSSHNCLQMDLQRLLEGGFKIGDSYIREPQGIRSYASLACIALDF